jgi:hypothetical protein
VAPKNVLKELAKSRLQAGRRVAGSGIWDLAISKCTAGGRGPGAGGAVAVAVAAVGPSVLFLAARPSLACRLPPVTNVDPLDRL